MNKIYFDDFNKYKIWSFDIDGVLNNYPILWLDYIYDKTKIRFDNTITAKYELKEKYELIKHQYRIEGEGVKYNFIISDEIKYFFNLLKSKQKEIIISTTRPFDKYPNMFDQTIEWLNKNNIEFSKLSNKYNSNINFDIHIDNEFEHIFELNNILSNKKYILYTKHNSKKNIENLSHNIDITIIDDFSKIYNNLNV